MMKILISIGTVWIMTVIGLFAAQAQSSPCDLVNNQESMLVFFAPLYANDQIKDILPQNTPYMMLGQNEGYFWIEYGQGERGWVDYHTIISNGACGDRTPISTPLSDFPTLCFYTLTQELEGYSNPDLVDSSRAVSPGTYAIAHRTSQAVQLGSSSAMSGPYVAANRGTYSGHCEGTLQLATALDNARVWTEPDAAVGQMVGLLDVGTDVGIIEGPVQGRLQIESDLQGNWYKVQRGDIVGWVWEERLLFGRTFTTQLPFSETATALDGARVWSQPDVRTGQIITTLRTGVQINITGDPVEGVIRENPNVNGIWYPVQEGGTTGWVFAERLALSS